MLKQIEKLCKKRMYIWIGVAIVIIAVTIFIQRDSLIRYIKGPVEIPNNTKINMADYEGMYVSYDVRLIWDCYAEKTETDKYDNTTTTGYQYMVMQYNEDYDGISGRDSYLYFFGIDTFKKDASIYDKIMEETLNWYNNESASLPQAIHVTGQVEKMGDEEGEYFDECVSSDMENSGYENFAQNYIIREGQINNVGTAGMVTCSAVELICVIWALYMIYMLICGSWKKKLNKFVKINYMDYGSLEKIDEAFDGAANPVKNVWQSRNITVWQSGTSANIIRNSDIQWAYYFKRTGKAAVSQIRIFTGRRNPEIINVPEAFYQRILLFYQYDPSIILGYDAATEKLYRTDKAGFAALRQKRANDALERARKYREEENKTADSSADESVSDNSTDGIVTDENRTVNASGENVTGNVSDENITGNVSEVNLTGSMPAWKNMNSEAEKTAAEKPAGENTSAVENPTAYVSQNTNDYTNHSSITSSAVDSSIDLSGDKFDI